MKRLISTMFFLLVAMTLCATLQENHTEQLPPIDNHDGNFWAISASQLDGIPASRIEVEEPVTQVLSESNVRLLKKSSVVNATASRKVNTFLEQNYQPQLHFLHFQSLILFPFLGFW